MYTLGGGRRALYTPEEEARRVLCGVHHPPSGIQQGTPLSCRLLLGLTSLLPSFTGFNLLPAGLYAGLSLSAGLYAGLSLPAGV